MDMMIQPDKVLAACEALMPHLYQVAMSGADPDGYAPIGFWMHRGCVPFISPDQFRSHYWPTLKPIIEELWAHGHQTMFYAEELGPPPGQFRGTARPQYPVSRGPERYRKGTQDLRAQVLPERGVPNTVLSYGTPQEVRDACKKCSISRPGTADSSWTPVRSFRMTPNRENVRAFTEFTREYGQYGSAPVAALPPRQ